MGTIRWPQLTFDNHVLECFNVILELKKMTAEWEPSGDLNQLLHSSWFGIVCLGIFCISYNGNHWPHFSTCCTRRVLDCFEMFGIHLKYFTVESIWSILKCIFRKCNDTVCGNHLVTSTNPNLSWIHFGSHSLWSLPLCYIHSMYLNNKTMNMK